MKLKYGIIFLILAVQALAMGPIHSATASGAEKYLFQTSEDVYAVGETTLSAGPEQPVDVYVLAEKPVWNQNDPFIDVSGGKETVLTDVMGHLPLTLVWTHPLAVGQYDLAIDINKNGILDNSDVVFSEWGSGFNVTGPGPGSGSVAKGGSSPGNHEWYYDPNADPYNELLQITITANQTEGIRVDAIDLKAWGTGNDATGVASVALILDSNGNGIREDGEQTLASAAYNADNGTAQLAISGGYTINAGTSASLLITYLMGASAKPGETFYFQVMAIAAMGASSGGAVPVTGTPITSAVKTTIQAPAQPAGCSGNITLSLAPTTVNALQTVTATATGLANCSDKTMYLREGSCTGVQKCSKNVSGSGASCGFKAPADAGNYTYFACVDKNGNGLFADAGESGPALLIVLTSAEGPCSSSNCSACTTGDDCAAAACSWCDGVCQAEACSPDILPNGTQKDGENKSNQNNTGTWQGIDFSNMSDLIIVIAAAGALAGIGLGVYIWTSRKPPAPGKKEE